MILLIDNYDSFTYNVYQYLGMLGAKVKIVRNDAITIAAMARLKLSGIVISPGPGNPDSAGVTLDTIREFSPKVPILGICLGHQAIGQAFGGRVVRAPKLMHGKLSEVYHGRSPLYRGVMNPMVVTRYHSLMIERKSLPRCLNITAETEDGIIMGVRHKKLPVEGVQFHPESYMSAEGLLLLKNFLEGC